MALQDQAAGSTTSGRANSPIGAAAWLVPARRDQPELLDQGIGSADDVRANLAEMGRLNRVSGGVSALTGHLYPLLIENAKPAQVVDLGAGSADLGRLVRRWAERRKLHVAVYSLDLSSRNLDTAREHIQSMPGAALVQADARALPFAENSVDYIISSLFLHHLAPDEVIAVLRDAYQRARRGIIMSDLVRGYLPLLAFYGIAPLFARHPLTCHDGALSIRRAYTPAELARLARAAGLETARVYSHFPWRMTLIAEKSRV